MWFGLFFGLEKLRKSVRRTTDIQSAWILDDENDDQNTNDVSESEDNEDMQDIHAETQDTESKVKETMNEKGISLNDESPREVMDDDEDQTEDKEEDYQVVESSKNQKYTTLTCTDLIQ
jgi:hypothetical protein